MRRTLIGKTRQNCAKAETKFTTEKKDLNAFYCIYNVMAGLGPY